MRGELLGVAFGEEAQAVQGTDEDRQQPVDPAVDTRLTQIEEAAQQGLQRIRLLVNEDEQQFVLGTQQDCLPAATDTALAWFARLGACGGKSARVNA